MASADKVELAKSARSSCKVCKNKIEKLELRVGTEFTDPRYGVGIGWRHVKCFDWSSTTSTDGIDGFAALDATNQALIVASLGTKPANAAAAPSKPAKPSGVAAVARGPSSTAAAMPRKKHPTQLDEDMPLERGNCKIQYATAKKPAPCMSCKGAIVNGEPRVGNCQPSPFYEGLQTRWLHLSCALRGAAGGVQRMSQLKGWDRMGYDVNVEIRKATDAVLSSKKEKALKNSMEPLDALQDLILQNLDADDLVKVLSMNGIDARDLLIDKNTISQAVIIADGMKNGCCANCPICNSPALVQCAGRIVCWGFLGGTTPCVYKAAIKDVERFAWKMPTEMLTEPWIVEWAMAAGGHYIIPSDSSGDKKKTQKKRKIENTAELPSVLPNSKKAKIKDQQANDARDNTVAGGGGSAKKKRKPKREVPMPGAPILEVHSSYAQTGNMSSAKVVADKSEVYNAMMNDVSIRKGVNRYYVLQAIERSDGTYELFRHDGATAAANREEEALLGRSFKINPDYKVYPHGRDKAGAIADFKAWFLKKTGNEWDERHNFVQRPGHYGFVELSTVNKDMIAEQQSGRTTAPCELDVRVQQLVEMLFDENNILNSMKDKGVDLDEMPLGAVTGDRVQRGREIMQRIKNHLEKPPVCAATKRHKDIEAAAQAKRVWDSQLEQLSTEFFLQIPAADAAIVESQENVQTKMDMLNMLSDIALTQKLLKQKKKKEREKKTVVGASAKSTMVEPHPLDEKYASLSCAIKPVERDEVVWSLIAKMLENTGVPLSSKRFLCGFKGQKQGKNAKPPQLLEVYDLARGEEPSTFAAEFSGLSDHRMLWHGTDVSVAAAICATGLRIMPNSGGRVGKGIYLADEANKSGYYVNPTSEGVGVMFLAEAALGVKHTITRDSTTAQRFSAKTLPKGVDSVVALGKTTPDPDGDVMIELDGQQVLFQTGGLRNRSAKELGAGKSRGSSDFTQTEYLVYKETQSRLRYLVLVKLW